MKERFIATLREFGECWVNYLQGAYKHFVMLDGAVYWDNDPYRLVYCGHVDSVDSLLQNLDYDLTLVASITSHKLS